MPLARNLGALAYTSNNDFVSRIPSPPVGVLSQLLTNR